MKKSGFTLIEVLVAATIIIVLATIGVVSYRQVGVTARDGKRKADLDIVRSALVLYRSEQGSYPTYAGQTKANYENAVSDLAGAGYLGQPTPSDPKDDSTFYYTYSSSGVSFSLRATLEEDESLYEVTNP